MEKSKTIIIADDHPIVRQGILDIVKQNPSFQIIHQCGTGEDALHKIRELKPDVVLLDISMPGMSGIEVIRKARKENIQSEFIILTMYNDEDYFEEAMDLGVKGYLLKENALLDLKNCLKSILEGEYYICPSLSGYLVRKKEKKKSLLAAVPALDLLTKTERKVLSLLSKNKTSREIAEEMFVSVRTVQNHRNNLCQKLNLKGPNALLEFAIRNRSELNSP